MLLQAFNDRYDKGRCFTTTRPCHCDDIEALKDNGYGSPLNRRWKRISLLLDGLEELWAQIVRLKATTSGLFLRIPAFRFVVHERDFIIIRLIISIILHRPSSSLFTYTDTLK